MSRSILAAAALGLSLLAPSFAPAQAYRGAYVPPPSPPPSNYQPYVQQLQIQNHINSQLNLQRQLQNQQLNLYREQQLRVLILEEAARRPKQPPPILWVPAWPEPDRSPAVSPDRWWPWKQ